MNKKIIGLLVVMFVLTLVVAGASRSEFKATKEIYSRLDDGVEKVRVFIEFKESENECFSISDAKENVVEIVGVRHSFGDKLSAYVSKEELAELEKDPNIKSIRPVRTFHKNLQDSVSLINGTITYPLQQNGFNLTGKDRTICIIDTGINYSHPDLGGCYGNNSLDSSCKIWGGYDYCADDIICNSDDDDPIDVDGHGTHVGGIAAANGTINGVAPDSRIIIIKAANSSGSFWEDDLVKAIDWCVNNASKFNISVISMSLGGGLYTDFCDTDYNTTLNVSITNAFNAHIPVVASTGNNGDSSRISAPACISTAIPVGWSNKDDSMNLTSNRNNLTLLVAPGSMINSTLVSGLYGILSGTSMATPHVSAAIAIISQFLNLTDQVKTPWEIEDALNDSGVVVDDSAVSGYNYTRINIYGTIISLDADLPSVTLVSPNNSLQTLDVNHTFRCNATDLALENMTFYLWNSSGDVINETFEDVSGDSDSFEINITNLANDGYEWNCLYFDENNNRTFASSNFSLFIIETNVTLDSPTNGLITNQNQTFVCNASSTHELSNVTFYLWNSTSGLMYNTTETVAGNSNSSSFSYNFTVGDAYSWNCLFVTNTKAEKFANSNYSITYDIAGPNISVVLPVNNSWYDKGRFNVSLDENGTCWYSLDYGAVNISMNTSDNRNFGSVNSTITAGEKYNVSYYCNDSFGYWGSTTRMFSIDTVAPSVTLVSPANEYSVEGSTTINFQFDVTDNLNITGCYLIQDDSIEAYNSSEVLTNATNTISDSVPVGNYTWTVNCTDEAGNAGTASAIILRINATSDGDDDSSSSSSSSSSSTTTTTTTTTAATYSPSKDAVASGYTKTVEENDTIKVILENPDGDDESHTINVSKISETYVKLIIESDPIEITMTEGSEEKLNLTSADYYDLRIRIDKIFYEDREVKITIWTINEPITGGISGNSISTISADGNETAGGSEKSGVIWWGTGITVGVIALSIAVIFLIRWIQKRRRLSGR